MIPIPEYCDNIRVKRGRNGCEYLAIDLRPADEHKPFWVYIYRYCVPGRCDTYSFQWMALTAKLVYFSDFRQDLLKIAKMAAEDFDRPQVVEMVLKAFRAERIVVHYRHDFLALLGIVAPKSKTYRALTKLCDQTMEERAARIKAEKVIPS